MDKICPNCHRTVAYDPYFKAYICRQCANVLEEPKIKRTVLSAEEYNKRTFVRLSQREFVFR